MKFKVSMTITLALLWAVGMGSNAWAGGTATNGVAPRAQSMQNAFTAVADDPSAVFYNPAGLTQIKGTEFDVGLMFMLPDMGYINSNNATSSSSTKMAYGGDFFFSTDMVEPVTLGLGVYAPFARSASYTANAAVNNLTQDSSLLRMDFVPSVAFDLGQYLSFGVGFVASYIRASSDILGFYEKGTGHGFTGQGGLLLKPHKRFKAGLSFRGPMSANVDGSGTLTGVGSDNYTLDLKFPGTLSVGLAWQVIDPLLISFNFDLEMWSYVNEIRRNYTNPAHQAAGVTTLNCDDSYDIRLGVMYKPWEPSEFRFGYSYITAATPGANIAPAQPDYDGHAFSIGYSHYLKHLRFDVGYEFDYMPTRSSNSAVFPGNYKMTSHVLLAGVAYKFGGE